MFEKAKMLAARGENVIFFITGWTSSEPSLLYYSLNNELKTCNLKVNDHLKVVMCTSASDIKKQIAGKNNLHLFIDEMTWSEYAYQEFIDLMEDISPDTYLWAAIGRIANNFLWDVIKIKEMMVEEYGFHIPNLCHVLRNSKQIFDCALNFSYLLPTECWSWSAAKEVTTPSNQTCGPTPIDIVQKSSLDESIAECFQHFPTSGGKILVIINFPTFPSQESDRLVSRLKEIVKTVRRCSPLVAIRKYSCGPLDEETRTAVKEWVENTNEQPQDLMVDSTFIGGFEWPSVLYLNFSNSYDSYNPFRQRNCIMRAMSRLVILNVDMDWY